LGRGGRKEKKPILEKKKRKKRKKTPTAYTYSTQVRGGEKEGE